MLPFVIIVVAAVLLAMTPAPCRCDPPLSDRDRFPGREEAWQEKQFNQEQRQHVAAWIAWQPHRREALQEQLDDLAWRYHCWDWLCAAQGGEGRDEDYWRESLGRLRDLLGDEAYLAGRMPPPIFPWRSAD